MSHGCIQFRFFCYVFILIQTTISVFPRIRHLFGWFMFILFTFTDSDFLIFIFLVFNFRLSLSSSQRQKYVILFDAVFLFVSKPFTDVFANLAFILVSFPIAYNTVVHRLYQIDVWFFFILILCVNRFFKRSFCFSRVFYYRERKKSRKGIRLLRWIRFDFVEFVNWKPIFVCDFSPRLCIFRNPKQYSRGYFIVVQLFYNFFLNWPEKKLRNQFAVLFRFSVLEKIRNIL